MKRLLTLVLCAAFVMSLTVGCGGDATKPATPAAKDKDKDKDKDKKDKDKDKDAKDKDKDKEKDKK